MGRLVSIALLFSALGVGISAPDSLAPLGRQELGEGIEELRRAISDAAILLSRIQRDEINSDEVFFEGQRRRLRGPIALARCIELANDGMPASRDKAALAASIRSIRVELSQAAQGVRSIQSANDHGHSLFTSKAFRPFDTSRAQPGVGVGESIVP